MDIHAARPKWAVIYLCLALLIGGACRAGSAPTSLYSRMGGASIVTAIVSDVIDAAASDPRLKRSFADVDLNRVKRLLVEQICELAGGGCRYSGDSMHDVHAGLGITQAEFYDLVQVLRDAMVRHGVALRERNELLKILAPMKRDVVEK
ncbi:MAG: group 1 truncated hemoglobin [Sinobacteraceae bacterium]|nr:group 1 truncated hemoglobin [Nevskiaceae bacterium]